MQKWSTYLISYAVCFLSIFNLILVPIKTNSASQTKKINNSFFTKDSVYYTIKKQSVRNSFYSVIIPIIAKRNISVDSVLFLTSQAALESGWGKCKLSKYNNIFGIKHCSHKSHQHSRVLVSTKEVVNSQTYIQQSYFATYKSISDNIDCRLTIKCSLKQYSSANVVPYIRTLSRLIMDEIDIDPIERLHYKGQIVSTTPFYKLLQIPKH